MKQKQKRKFEISIEQDQMTPTKQICTTPYSTSHHPPPFRRAKTFSDAVQLSQPYTPNNTNTRMDRMHQTQVKKLQSVPNMSKSVNFIPLGYQAKEIKVGTPKNKLIFKHKRAKTVDKRQERKNKLQVGFGQLVRCMKQIVVGLEQVISEMQQQYNKLIETASKDIESMISAIARQQQKLNAQRVHNLSSFSLKNEQCEQKVQEYQVPTLDLSKIVQPNQKPTKQITNIAGRYSDRKAQTERNVSDKKFEFSIPMRATRKFQNFNQTLNKIKRLSFGGAILKL